MRVLLLNQTFFPDVAATAQHAHDLGLYLVGEGHEVAVVTSRSRYGERGASLPVRETVDGIEIHRVGFSLFGKTSLLARSFDFLLFYVLAAFKSLRVARPDVVVPFTTPPFIALVGYLMKRFRGCGFVYWLMDLYPDVVIGCGMMKPDGLTARALERIHRSCLRRADKIVVLGRCMRRRVMDKGIDGGRLKLIRPWADSDEVRPIPGERNPYRREWSLGDAFVVMHSGNLGLGHDVETMCEAMRELRDRDDIRFVIVGGGQRKLEVERFVERHGLRNVTLRPYQPRARLDELLSLGDLHVISLADPLVGVMVPSKLFGILAAARPAVFVGHPDSEIGRVLLEEECGFNVRCGDSDGFARAVRELAADPALTAAMGSRARESLRRKYDRVLACAEWQQVLTAHARRK